MIINQFNLHKIYIVNKRVFSQKRCKALQTNHYFLSSLHYICRWSNRASCNRSDALLFCACAIDCSAMFRLGSKDGDSYGSANARIHVNDQNKAFTGAVRAGFRERRDVWELRSLAAAGVRGADVSGGGLGCGAAERLWSAVWCAGEIRAAAGPELPPILRALWVI